jgi:hypothetical protein
MTRPDIAAIRAAIAKRGDCAGPLTTFPTPTLTHVAICCGKNWVEVIEWLAMCERDIPALLAWCEEVEGENAKLREELVKAEENRVRMAEYRFALEGVPTDGKGNPIRRDAYRKGDQ